MNLHSEALLHCVLASRDDQGHSWVQAKISQVYPDLIDFRGLGDKTDFGYILVLPEKIVVAVSGTIGPILISPAWWDNYNAIAENGLHRGWNESWYDLFAEPVRYYAKRSERPIKLFGLSRGAAISLRGALWLREELSYADVEHIGFCGPMLTNRRGYARMKAAKVRSTRWYNAGLLRDPIDDIGVIGGKHYGLAIPLPDPPNIIPVMDHDYPNVCEAMSILMRWWNKPDDADFCYSVKKYCR